jgi:hypothetical protein
MKTWLWQAAVLTTVVAMLALSGNAQAQGTDNDGCSNSTLQGDYAFTVSGQIFHQNGTVETRTGVAMTHFDGSGGLRQVDFVMTFPDKNGQASPVPGPSDPTTNFHVNETGTYTVYRDCTGTAEINMPAPPVPGATGAKIVLMFVLSDHGRSIHTVVSSLIPPSTQPPINGALIHSDGHKLGRVPEDHD